MLENIFLTVVRMSITASIAALTVILFRFAAGKKLPKSFSYAAWAIVLIRLLVPFSIESGFSLFNIMKSAFTAVDRVTGANSTALPGVFGAGEQDRDTIAVNETEAGMDENMYLSNENDVLNVSSRTHITKKEDVRSEKTGFVSVMSCIWISVFMFLLVFCICAYIKTRGEFRTAVLFNDNGLLSEVSGKLYMKRKVNIYVSDRTDTPFVSGIANVRIIIPSYLAVDYPGRRLEYVITHELVHIKRLDNITSLLAVLALCIHWFNPLMWLCFNLYRKDMETSCDTVVLEAYENDIRSDYANLLLNIAVKQNTLSYGTVPAFGESNIKGRIKGIMRFKKNEAWAGIIAAVLLAVLAFVLLTDGKNVNIINTGPSVIRHNVLNNLLEHRSRYIGDASNAGNLLDKLPYGNEKTGFELDTDSEPYGITVNYWLGDINTSNGDTGALKKVKSKLLDNALVIFSLIENVDVVKFNILPSKTEIQFERAELQQYFDRDLWEYSENSEDFEKFLLDIYFDIFVFPEKYSVDISSLPGPGIQISPVLNEEYYDAACSIRYSTESGSLLVRNEDTGDITNQGKLFNCTLASGNVIYWNPLGMNETGEDNTVTVSVLKKNGDVIISKHVFFEKDDNQIFTVRTSYDIIHDYAGE